MHTQLMQAEAAGRSLQLPGAADQGQSRQKKVAQGQRQVYGFLMVVLLALGLSSPASASHFRSGNITWRVVSGNTVEFRLAQGWRDTPQLGSTMYSDRFYFGDGTSQQFAVVATAVDTAEDWYYGEVLLTKTYANAGNYTAYFGSCCRISDLQNNADGSWRLQTIVNAGSGNNAPVATVPPIIKLASGKANANFKIPASDPDGNTLTYRMAIPSRMGGGSNPAGMTVDSLTGQVRWSTLGLTDGHLYNAAVTIFDGQTEITVDFIVEITGNSNAPYFDYAVTPANGRVIDLNPGQPLTFTVRALDADSGDLVRLQGIGMPVGATLAPAQPVIGNPVNALFTWTPSSTDIGTKVIIFTAQDLVGVQATTSIIIKVGNGPRFDVPPTPMQFSTTGLLSGVTATIPLQASDADQSDAVQIISATGLPAGAGFSTALPTPAANPTSTALNWTPGVADWGTHQLTVTAKDSHQDQSTHQLNFIVNTLPVFTSAPVTTAKVGQLYTYSIQVNEPDLPYGDVLEIIGNALPTWLTITDNGNGTATLSGIPQADDAGANPVELFAEDIYHHVFGTHISQAFTINVANCDMVLSFVAAPVSCSGQANGSVDLTVTSGTAPFTYVWLSGQLTQDLSGLAAGSYSVTVTDANGCSATGSVSVADATPVSVQLTATSDYSGLAVSCAGASDGSVSASVSGGTGTYSYSWTGSNNFSSTQANLTNLPAGTYTLLATDGNGCTASNTVTLVANQAPVVTLASFGTVCNGATVALTGGSPAGGVYSGTGVDGNNFSTEVPGAYQITYTYTTDAGCSASATASVTVAAPLVANAGSDQQLQAPVQACAALIGSAQGGTAPYTYSWSNGVSGSTVSVCPTSATTYTLTVTDAMGCTSTDEVTIHVQNGSCGHNGEKVLVCHNGHTICISANAVPAHLAHGCSVGTCEASRSFDSGNETTDAMEMPLLSASPNPASNAARMEYSLPEDGQVTLELYDARGALVKALCTSNVKAGQTYAYQLETEKLAQGVYVARLSSAAYVQHLRLIVQQ